MENNYYKIHKNKSPKARLRRKRRGYVSIAPILIANIKATGAMQTAAVLSQPIPKYASSDIVSPKSLKTARVFQCTLETAAKVIEVMAGEKQRRFKATKRYVR